jgi:uncharacterized integral membrane protein
MTEPMAAHRTTSTLPPPSANRSSLPPSAPRSAEGPSLQARLSRMRTTRMRTTLIATLAALIVAVIFIIQNAHAANISFLGVHLVLPLAGALLLAAIAGSLATIAAGPARITRLRQIIRHHLRKAVPAKQPPMTLPSPLTQASTSGPETPAAFAPRDPGRPTVTSAYSRTRD